MSVSALCQCERQRKAATSGDCYRILLCNRSYTGFIYVTPWRRCGCGWHHSAGGRSEIMRTQNAERFVWDTCPSRNNAQIRVGLRVDGGRESGVLLSENLPHCHRRRRVGNLRCPYSVPTSNLMKHLKLDGGSRDWLFDLDFRRTLSPSPGRIHNNRGISA